MEAVRFDEFFATAGYVQTECITHEYTEVIWSSISNDGITTNATKVVGYQCRFCGKILEEVENPQPTTD